MMVMMTVFWLRLFPCFHLVAVVIITDSTPVRRFGTRFWAIRKKDIFNTQTDHKQMINGWSVGEDVVFAASKERGFPLVADV